MAKNLASVTANASLEQRSQRPPTALYFNTEPKPAQNYFPGPDSYKLYLWHPGKFLNFRRVFHDFVVRPADATLIHFPNWIGATLRITYNDITETIADAYDTLTAPKHRAFQPTLTPALAVRFAAAAIAMHAPAQTRTLIDVPYRLEQPTPQSHLTIDALLLDADRKAAAHRATPLETAVELYTAADSMPVRHIRALTGVTDKDLYAAIDEQRMPRRKQLTLQQASERKETAMRLYERGVDIRSIADTVGVSVSSAYRYTRPIRAREQGMHLQLAPTERATSKAA